MSGTRVFIGRLAPRIRESDVERFFKGFGKLRDINLKNGYGFVEFDDGRDADDAVYELNNRELCGGRVTVEHARGRPRAGERDRYDDRRGGDRGGYRGDRDRYDDRGGRGGGAGRVNYYESRAISKYGPPTRTKYRVIVENLSTRVSWQDLKDYLREAGEVTYADAHKHRKNEGVVDFATYDDMRRAIDKMDNTEINGRKIRLIEDGATKSQSRSRSRSRSRSPRRSRSRSDSRSRSRSPRRSRSRSRSNHDENGRSPARNDSRSRSRSRTPEDRNGRSRSRSRSPTPEHRDD